MQHERETYLTVKAAEQDGERWIEGWATTPSVDLVGDVVSPQGAVFSLPLPLLFAHRHDEPIGAVVRANASSAGIRIRARLTAGVANTTAALAGALAGTVSFTVRSNDTTTSVQATSSVSAEPSDSSAGRSGECVCCRPAKAS